MTVEVACSMRIGVLALQGAFREHLQTLDGVVGPRVYVGGGPAFEGDGGVFFVAIFANDGAGHEVTPRVPVEDPDLLAVHHFDVGNPVSVLGGRLAGEQVCRL